MDLQKQIDELLTKIEFLELENDRLYSTLDSIYECEMDDYYDAYDDYDDEWVTEDNEEEDFEEAQEEWIQLTMGGI